MTKDTRYIEYNEKHVSFLFDAQNMHNIKMYEKLCNDNEIDFSHRQEVWAAHLEYLNCYNAITDDEQINFTYIGKEKIFK